MMILMKIMIKMMTIAKIMSVSGRGCQQRFSGKKSRDKLEHSSHRYPKHIIIFSMLSIYHEKSRGSPGPHLGLVKKICD